MEKYSMEEELLFISRQDLKSARILYEAGLFPQSVYFFQQSVEKAYKSLGLMSGFITENDLVRGISHKSPLIYSKALNRAILRYDCLKTLSSNPELKKKLSKIVNLDAQVRALKREQDDLQAVLKKDTAFVTLSLDELLDIVDALDECWERYEKEKKQSKANIAKSKRTIINVLRRLDKAVGGTYFKQQISLLEHADPTQYEKVMKFLLKWTYSWSISLIFFHYLGMLTYPHAQRSRYPHEQSPRKLYLKRLPLIKLMPDLMFLHEAALDEYAQCRYLIKNSKRYLS